MSWEPSHYPIEVHFLSFYDLAPVVNCAPSILGFPALSPGFKSALRISCLSTNANLVPNKTVLLGKTGNLRFCTFSGRLSGFYAFSMTWLARCIHLEMHKKLRMWSRCQSRKISDGRGSYSEFFFSLSQIYTKCPPRHMWIRMRIFRMDWIRSNSSGVEYICFTVMLGGQKSGKIIFDQTGFLWPRRGANSFCRVD